MAKKKETNNHTPKKQSTADYYSLKTDAVDRLVNADKKTYDKTKGDPGKEYRSKDRSIEFVSQTTGTYPPKEKVVKDKKLKAGKKVVEKQGHTGYTAKLWKIIHEKGKEDKKELVNSSSYMSTPRVVRLGTKKAKKKDKKDTKKDKQEDGKKNKNTEKKKGETDSEV